VVGRRREEGRKGLFLLPLRRRSEGGRKGLFLLPLRRRREGGRKSLAISPLPRPLLRLLLSWHQLVRRRREWRM